jgi:hypothetical protein
MQVAADAIVRNNIIIGAPVAFQKHQVGSPSNIEFVNNTIIAPGDAINLRDVMRSRGQPGMGYQRILQSHVRRASHAARSLRGALIDRSA